MVSVFVKNINLGNPLDDFAEKAINPWSPTLSKRLNLKSNSLRAPKIFETHSQGFE